MPECYYLSSTAVYPLDREPRRGNTNQSFLPDAPPPYEHFASPCCESPNLPRYSSLAVRPSAPPLSPCLSRRNITKLPNDCDLLIVFLVLGIIMTILMLSVFVIILLVE